MTKYDDINARVRALLEDGAAQRFSADLLAAAMRQALEEMEQRLPRVLSSEFTVISSGREQALLTIDDCRYIISVTTPGDNGAASELQPETCFTYVLLNGTPTLHFLGAYIPAAGDGLTLHYTAGYTIEGLDDALDTTLPSTLEGALVDGAAAQACLLRAGSLVGRYGSDPRESSRLMAIGQLWRATFERALNGLKLMQDFGFPPGFPLDKWDRVRK
ncbi:MAG TPA: hypothetical protein PKK59_03550 [Anaerolineaceae bacterium]|nr:hypothetical protein [Anaerolineaceae bacterium]